MTLKTTAREAQENPKFIVTAKAEPTPTPLSWARLSFGFACDDVREGAHLGGNKPAARVYRKHRALQGFAAVEDWHQSARGNSVADNKSGLEHDALSRHGQRPQQFAIVI